MGADKVDLSRLGEICTLSRGVLDFWKEAAAVMLDKFHAVPPPPTPVVVEDGGETSTLHLEWPPPTSTMRESHANEIEATESGACGVAVAAVHHRGFVVRRRAHQVSGADLLMVRVGEPDNDFIKLEISGIARGHALDRRLSEKLEQVSGGDLRRPGVALVVGFEAARIKMGRRS